MLGGEGAQRREGDRALDVVIAEEAVDVGWMRRGSAGRAMSACKV
jgi:hypothetical protein